MRAIVFSLYIFGSLGPFFAEASNYEDFINSNGTATVIDQPKKHQLTTEQKSLVQAFRTQYSDLLTDDYLRSSSHISGLLQANKWSLVPASKKLKRVLNWRSTDKIDELNNVEPDPDLQRLFPWRITTKSRDGCPVMEVAFGQWLLADFIQSKEFVRDGVKAFNRHADQMWERIRSATKELAPKCEQAVYIADIKGFAFKNVAEANALNSLVRMALNLNDKYYNIFQSMICLNAPPDFSKVLKIIQPALGDTIKGFTVYSEKQIESARKHIISYIDPAELRITYLGN